MRTIQDMIQQEVLCCMSSMVSTLANGDDSIPLRDGTRGLVELAEQAAELCYPIPDYEEAAIQADAIESGGFWHFRGDPKQDAKCVTAEGFCVSHDIEPIDREVYEHWAVTDWFAKKLAEHGEKVDEDFAGLCIWARTTTGQAIQADGVIERIYAAMVAA